MLAGGNSPFPYMDVVFLVYGLAFLAMSLTITIRYDHDSKLVLSKCVGWLAAFGLVHGLLEWLDLWRVVRGSSFELLRFRSVVLWLSYLFLIEFGRRLVQASLLDREAVRYALPLSGWLYLPLHLLLWLMVSAYTGDNVNTVTDIAIRYTLGFPGSLLAALGFFLFCSRKLDLVTHERLHRIRQACLLAALACVAYAVLAGLIVPAADVFPARWLNQEGFLALFQVPVQLFRAACAVLLSIAVAVLLKVFHYEVQESLNLGLETAQRLLRHNELILASSGEGILGINPAGEATFINDSGLRLLGFGREELLGRSVHQMTHHTMANGQPYPPQDCPIHATLHDHLWRQVDEDFFWKKDGQGFPVEYTVAPIMEAGSCQGAVVVFRDVRIRKETEAELERYRHRLETQVAERTLALSVAKESAEAASRAKTLFLSNMSHELHTPLNAILGFSHILQRRLADPEPKQTVEKIVHAATRLLKLLDDVLDLSRIESERLTLSCRPFLLTDVFRETVAQFVDTARIRGLALTLEISPELETVDVLGDALRLKQVLYNLVDNAIKFTPHGQVEVVVMAVNGQGEHLSGVAGQGGCFILRAEVRDSGIGMSPRIRQRIFEPFEQADPSRTRKFGGTGLGLALSRKLLEIMGGQIGVHSEEGAGSTFWFEVNLCLPEKRCMGVGRG